MPPQKTYAFTGIISTVTPRGNAAIVTLNETELPRQRAVINDQTTGRIALMSTHPDGTLQKGCAVKGEGTLGPEAFLATSISPA